MNVKQDIRGTAVSFLQFTMSRIIEWDFDS